jgi:hypothetical protein
LASHLLDVEVFVTICVADGEIVAAGLSMPHWPRLLNGSLWLRNSGICALCAIAPGR